MYPLSLAHANGYVLRALDEIRNLEGDVDMLGDSDDLDTRKLVSGYIVEAALKAHKDAPSFLIDGVVGTEEVDYSFDVLDDLSAEIVFLKDSARLASIKASDSDFVVCDHAPQESPIGRMQKNPYTKGTYDDPRLIEKKVWADGKKPEYLYYSVKDNTATFVVEYVPYPEIEDDSVMISDKMEYAVLNLLTAMVLDALSLHDKANLYREKYKEYLRIHNA